MNALPHNQTLSFVLTIVSVLTGLIGLLAWKYPDFWHAPSSESRIDVTNVIPVPARSDKGMGLFVNVFYANHGKSPVKRMAHRCVLQYAEEPLSQAQEDALMATANALNFPNNLTDAVEIEPGDYPKHYFSCPGSDEAIAAAARYVDVLKTKHRLYVAVAMKYQDERTPRNTVTITEFCGWFGQTFEMWHNCGKNRVIVQALNGLGSRH